MTESAKENIRQEARIDRGLHYRGQTSPTDKNVKSRFSPGARQAPKTSQVIVMHDNDIEQALEMAADVGAVIVEVEGAIHYLEGADMMKNLQEILEAELAEGRGALVKHWRSRAGYMSSKITTVVEGRTLPGGVKVENDATLASAMKLADKGPVRLFGPRKSYIITHPDQLKDILHEQLEQKHVVTVAPYEPPVYDTPPPTVEPVSTRKPVKDMVVFRDEAGLKRAFDLLRGKVDEWHGFEIFDNEDVYRVYSYPEALQALYELAQPDKFVTVRRIEDSLEDDNAKDANN